MSNTFDTLSRSEKIKFWQTIENKLNQVLQQCAAQLPAGVIEEAAGYLAQNELGLAWETLSDELVTLNVVPPKPAQQIMIETGICMRFNQEKNRNHILWERIVSLFKYDGEHQRQEGDDA